MPLENFSVISLGQCQNRVVSMNERLYRRLLARFQTAFQRVNLLMEADDPSFIELVHTSVERGGWRDAYGATADILPSADVPLAMQLYAVSSGDPFPLESTII